MNVKYFPVTLTIAGSDSGGGAGIQADLKTFTALGTFGTTVITAVTAQNLDGVSAVQPIEPGVVEKQLIAVLDGFPVRAIKTGMLFSTEIIGTIAKILSKPSYQNIPLVIDPVFAATSGSQLIRDDAIDELKQSLFPKAALITPNIPEAEILTGTKLNELTDLKTAASTLYKTFKVPILLKGGHLETKAQDVLCFGKDINNDITIYETERVKNVNSHGSGCALASAITAGLAKGLKLEKAVTSAKHFIQMSLEESLSISPELRVINHFHEYMNMNRGNKTI